MRRMPSRFLASFTVAVVALGQIPPSALPPNAVIKTTTRIVNVNVIATDRKGNPVTDLSKEDFVVKDNGKERPISLFSLERTDTAGARAEAKPKTALPAGTFTNHVSESTTGVTIFLFDGLNTRFEDQARVKQQLVKYLGEVDVNDRVALFALGTNLLLLHDFTTDTKSLIDAINKRASRINNEVADAEPLESNTGNDDMDAFLDSANQKISDFTNINRATTTAAALEAIAEHVARIPGRKNLVWVSGGFPIMIGFDTAMKIGDTRERRTFSPEIDRATRALNNANLAVYPVDARGLQTNVLSAANTTPKNMARGGSSPGLPPPDRNYDAMESVATATGGRAFHNLNDLASAIKTATSDARVSYALAFTPPSETLDGKFHELKVETKRSGVHLRFRKGYFAFPDVPQPSLTEAITNPSAYAGVGITVNLKPVEKSMVAAAITLDARDITLTPAADGNWKGALQILVIGGPLPKELRPTAVNVNLTAEGFAGVQKNGLVLTTKLSAPAGPYQYHIGIRDVPSGAVGTIHLVKNDPAPQSSKP
jgi:VWFA-related protein